MARIVITEKSGITVVHDADGRYGVQESNQLAGTRVATVNPAFDGGSLVSKGAKVVGEVATTIPTVNIEFRNPA